MKWLIVFMAVVMSSPVAAADITSPVFKQYPTGKQLGAVYPLGELDQLPDTFRVEMRCRIQDRAGHMQCMAIGENPAGFGCGSKAAVIFSQQAIIDMRRTQGAMVGDVALVHVSLING
jgi:hypothetical protein